MKLYVPNAFYLNGTLHYIIRAGVVAWPGRARAPPIFGENSTKHTVGPPQYLGPLISGPPNFKIATPALYCEFVYTFKTGMTTFTFQLLFVLKVELTGDA